MDAPLYAPATAFTQPERLPEPPSTAETPITALRADSAAWAIVLEEIPGMDARISHPAIQPHLGNFSLRSLLPFGLFQAAVLDRIEAKFRKLDQAQ